MTLPSSLPRVIFFQVRDNSSKLKKIVEMATLHFEKKEPFLILVEDEKSQIFVDELLWKLPPTSFLPHKATDAETNDWIAIAKGKSNVNQARVVFNLCPTPLLIDSSFKIIYEFEDLSTPSKKNLSSHRFDAYKQAGFFIEAR
jgi:DNA polymerase IIIc chi subunit